MVSQKGIEANPKKLGYNRDEVPKLSETSTKIDYKITTFNYFMSRAINRYLRFFKLLRKIKKFEQTKECQ